MKSKIALITGITGQDYISVTGKLIDQNDILAGVDATLYAYKSRI